MEESSLLEFLKKFFGKKEEDFPESLSKEEEEFLRDFLFIKNLEVRDLLIPRLQIKAIDSLFSWEEVKEFIITHPHRYYPVYNTQLDNYIGYVSLKDLLRGFKGLTFNWLDYVKPSPTLLETLPLLTALKKLKNTSSPLGFVIDEFSELVGIIFLHDIYETLFLSPKKCFKPDQEGWLLLPATIKLHILERCLNLTFPEGDFETLAGFILQNSKEIPAPGKRLVIPPLEIEILKADEKKIEEVRVRKIS